MQIEELTEALSKVGGLPIAELLMTLQAVGDKMESLNDEIWTQEACAQHLGVTPACIRQWSRDMGLPRCQRGSKVYYIKSDIIAWLRESSGAGLSEEADKILSKINNKTRHRA